MENPIKTLSTRIQDKKILITGGTTGIGRAAVLMLAQMGAKIVFCGRNEAPLQDTLREVENNRNVKGIIADLSKKDDIKKLFEEVDEFLGGLDVLVNNAALGYGSITEGNFEEWQYILNSNLMNYLACSHEAIARMKPKGKGQILNIGSMSADVREEGSSLYVATKSAIQGFSSSLRKEVNQQGIKVSLIEPGAVNTDMQELPEEEKQEKIKNQEMLHADDIALAIMFTIAQPHRCDIVDMKIRPLKQLI